MNPVLIYTDTLLINSDKAVLAKSVILFQNVYNDYKAIGITPTLQDIYQQVSGTLQSFGKIDTMVNNYALNQLAAKAGNYEYNGVQLNQSVLMASIVVPDLSIVKAALQTSFNTFGNLNGTMGLRFDLLTLVNDVVGTVADSDAQIAANYTYYTKTDASAQLATDLQAVCNAMNTFNGLYQNTALVAKFGNVTPNAPQKYSVTSGIDAVAGVCVVSLNFIRTFERMQAN